MIRVSATVFCLVFGTVLFAGCASESAKSAAQPEAKASSGGASVSKPEAGANSGSALAEVPVELKHAAFDYYGLGVSVPVNIEVSDDVRGDKRTGTRTIEVGKIENGKVTFLIKQSGALEDQGDVTVSLEPDGVFAMSSSKGTMKPHTLEMPTSIAPGASWEDNTELATNGTSIKLTNKVKAEKFEKITTKVGTYDEALLVTSTGSGTISGKPGTLTTRSWYVKGRGAVRQVIDLTLTGQPKRTISMEEIP